MNQRNFLPSVIKSYENKRSNLFINTIPKSGSVYIQNAISDGLGIKLVSGTEISGGAFPEQMLIQQTGYDNLGKTSVLQNHVPANKMNLSIMELYYPKFVLHVRDPRQALISWTHFTNKVWNDWNFQVYKSTLGLSIDFPNLTIDKQFSIMIDKWYPLLIDWLEGWKEELLTPKYKVQILLTKQEELHKNQTKFFSRILKFHKIPENKFKFPEKPQPGKLHFRKGGTSEWIEVLSNKQKDKLKSLSPKDVFEFYKWKI
jgi:hypothetical protein